jgi:hypothetical protein
MAIRRSIFVHKRCALVLSLAALVACSPHGAELGGNVEPSTSANETGAQVASTPKSAGAELAAAAPKAADPKLVAKVYALAQRLRDEALAGSQPAGPRGYSLSPDGEITGEFEPILTPRQNTHHGDPVTDQNWSGRTLDARLGTNVASLTSQIAGLTLITSLPQANNSCGDNTPCPDPLLQQTVKWVDPNGHVIEAFFNRGNNRWSSDDLTLATSAPPAKGPLVAFQTVKNLQTHLMYIGLDNHIHELFFDLVHWHHNDLTQLTSAKQVAATARALTGYQTTPDNKERVDFVDVDGDIVELSFGSSWSLTNVTQNAHNTDPSTPEAQLGSALAGYQFTGQQHIDFIAASGDLFELSVGTDGNWHPSDLTTAAKAVDPNTPAPQATSALTAYATSFNNFVQLHIDFIGQGNEGTTGDVFELMFDGSPHPRDLTSSAGAPIPNPASQLAGYATTYNGQQHVDFIDGSGNVQELLFDGTNWLSNNLFSGSNSDVPAGTVAGTAALAGFQLTSPDIQGPSQQHVSFVSSNDSHVHDIFLNSGGTKWTDTDLTQSALVPWVTAVGTWQVPTISQPLQGSSAVPADVALTTNGWDSSTWVGIDGDPHSDGTLGTPTHDVLQAGTQQALMDDGSAPQYSTWFEWFTHDTDPVDKFYTYPYIEMDTIESVPASPGDTISVTINHAGSFGFITLANLTTGHMVALGQLTPPPLANFEGGSAEWIMETPTVGHITGDELAILPDFTPVKFTQATTTDANGGVDDPSNAAGGRPDHTDNIDRPDFFGHDINLTHTTFGLDQCEVDRVDWYDNDLAKMTGAPPAAAAGRLVGFTTTFNNQQHVVYTGNDGDIHELLFPVNNAWQNNDLTMQLKAMAPAAGSSLTGYQTTYDNQEHIDYVSSDGHIRELWFDTTWHTHDLWDDAHQLDSTTPTAVATSRLNGFQTSFNSQQHVNYIASTDGSVRELWYDKTINKLWQAHNPWGDAHSANGNTPKPFAGTALAGYETAWNKQQHINYISGSAANAQVNELWFDTAWHWNNLTGAATGSPGPQQGSALGSFASPSNSQQHVNFVTPSGQIVELVYNNPTWSFNNLSVKGGIPNVVASPRALIGYQEQVNNQYRVDFISTSTNDVMELNFDGKNWIGRDLTIVPQTAGFMGQPTAATSRLASYETSQPILGSGGVSVGMSNDQNHVDYIGMDNDVHELLHGP